MIAAVIAVFDERGELDRRPLGLTLVAERGADGHARCASRQGAGDGLGSAVRRRHEPSPDRVSAARRASARRASAAGTRGLGRRRLRRPPSSTSRRAWRSSATRSTSPTPRTTLMRAVDLERTGCHDDRRHRRAGQWGRRGRRGARDVAASRRGTWRAVAPAALHRDGRRPPDLDARPRARPRVAVRRQRARKRASTDDRRGRVRAAVGPRVPGDVLSTSPTPRATSSAAIDAAAGQQRRRRWPAATCSTSAIATAPATTCGCSIRWASLAAPTAPGPALHRRHLQPPHQGARSGHAECDDPRRHRARPDIATAPGRRHSSTSRAV